MPKARMTPGGWYVSESVGDYHPRDRLFILSGRPSTEHPTIVAEIQLHRPGSADRRPVSWEEQISNAHLLAGAKELLDMALECRSRLRGMKRALEHGESTMDCSIMAEHVEQMLLGIDDAIEGSEP